MKKVVIWGAGEWGKLAYYYYRNSCEIVNYIDNDINIWGTIIHGISVCSPDVLKKKKYTVIVACKRYEEEIKKQLIELYGIDEVISFRIVEKMQKIPVKILYNTEEDEVIVSFSDGLGNQMFQYALYKIFQKQKKNVTADLSAYLRPDMRPFILPKVFENIALHECTPEKKELYLSQGKVYIDEPPKNEIKQTFNPNLIDFNYGYIEGWHCSYRYPQIVRDELLYDFQFQHIKDEKLRKLAELLEHKEFVGVQVRRGDFLIPKYKRELGDICDSNYYKKAFQYIKRMAPRAAFCFFSDDIEWVKNNMEEENAIYIEVQMFDTYFDWYDMYLMSLCKYNIIPNSTFGWWGAWLNRNPNKIVIAPKKWRENWKASDWCPPEWIRL